jgi:DnaJ-class molecular chaperone
MAANHYEALGLSQDATMDEIREMYKKLSLIYHPDKNSNKNASEKFKQICEANEILSDEKSRSKYDSTLKKEKEKAEKDAEKLKVKLDKRKSRSNTSLGVPKKGKKERPRSNQPPIKVEVFCSYETLLNGRKKTRTIKRLELQANGQYALVKKKFEIEVKPGYADKTEITFPHEGNQVGDIPGDVIFIIREKSHNKFEREGSDLKHKVKLSRKESRHGKTVKIPQLSEDPIELNIKGGQIDPSIIKRYKGKGLLDSQGKRGDLLVEFEIENNQCGCIPI